MNRYVLPLLTAAAFALASCGDAPTTSDFVRKAAMDDLYAVAAGKIAAEKGQSDAVRQFGQRMVDAHSKTSEDLRRIVESEALGIALPAKLSRRYHVMVGELTTAKPEDFDKLYAEQQVKLHKKAVAFFDGYAEAGDNPALKQFAANVLPMIKQHKEEADRLEESL